MGVDDRYPKRLRNPPLRFWMNERKTYHKGYLTGVNLLDDERGK